MTYLVSARLTISLCTRVDAESKEQAIRIAESRELPAIRDEGDIYETWATSGELDGSPESLEASPD